MHLLTDIAGYLGFASLLVAYQLKLPRRTLIALLCSSLFWALHFVIKGAHAGLIVTLLGAVRSMAGIWLDDRKMRPVVIACFVAAIATIAWTFQQWADLLPAAAAAGFTLSVFARDKPFLFRLLCLWGEVSWLLYGLAIDSTPMKISQVCLISLMLLSIIRFDLRGRSR